MNKMKTGNHSIWPLAALVFAAAVDVSTAAAQAGTVTRVGMHPMVHEGFTEPRHDIMVAAVDLGRIESIDVHIGDAVQAGQVIARLEDDLQQVSVALAELQAAMTGELDATRAEVAMNQSRTLQLRQLAADEMARPDELARAETDLQIAVARHTASVEQVEVRKLELDRYRLQLERRKVRAPATGVIANVLRHPGEYITPADPAIVRLLVTDKLYAVFNVPVEDIATIRVGSLARVFLRSNSTAIEAPVTSIAPNIDGESGTVQVRVELDNPRGELLAGDRCTLQILSDRRSPDPRAALGRPAQSTGTQR